MRISRLLFLIVLLMIPTCFALAANTDDGLQKNSGTAAALRPKLAWLNVNEEKLVDIYGTGQPLTVRYNRVASDSPWGAESTVEFYNGDRLVEKYIAQGKTRAARYSVAKAQLRDEQREEIVGILIDGTGMFINDLLVIGSDDQGRIVSFPIEIKTRKTGDILHSFEEHGKELWIPFKGNPHNTALILRWDSATGKFVLADNFNLIPTEPVLNAPRVLTKDEGESLGGYTLMDRHWYSDQGKMPVYDRATGEHIFRHGDVEVHAVRTGRNYYNINVIIIDGPNTATSRGIRSGEPAEKVIEAYGSPLINEYGDLILYEYGCESKADSILRFAVKKSTMTVDYISLRVTDIWKKVFPTWE